MGLAISLVMVMVRLMLMMVRYSVILMVMLFRLTATLLTRAGQSLGRSLRSRPQRRNGRGSRRRAVHF